MHYYFIVGGWLIAAFIFAMFLGHEYSKRKREEKAFIEFMESLHK